MSQKTIIIFFIVTVCKLSGQESGKTSFSSSIGAGAQIFASRNDNVPHSSAQIHYNGISPQIFYRLIFKGKKFHLLCLTTNLSYRSGYGSYSRGGLGGGATTSGSFKLLRGEIGLNYLWAFGAEKTTYWGFGLGTGQLLSANGNAKTESWSISNGSTETTTPIKDCLNKTILNFNTEFCKEIRDGKRNSLFLGIRLSISGSDGFSGSAASATLLVSYNFRKKDSVKS